MNKITIGINQRIPMSILEMALFASLQDQATNDYLRELVATEFTGDNRIRLGAGVLHKLTCGNPLLPIMRDRKDDVIAGLRSVKDRPIILSAVINAAYSIGYDVTSILGKYLHVQTEVSTALLTSKLAEKYGSNRSMPNGRDCVVPMLIEAGLFKRSRIGFYEAIRHRGYSDLAADLYLRSFFVHNTIMPEDSDVSTFSYFEFLDY